ncbi:MAG: RidA family protein [Anaerolineales bacterium]|nr:RidA family protein [Anaerolineales bacterium]
MAVDVIFTDRAPRPVGPYSQAYRAGGILYTAGQVALDPTTGELVPGGIAAQTRQALRNLEAVLAAGGSSLGNVVKTTIFMADLAEFSQMNAVYAEFFTQNPPARSTVQVAGLPKGARVEIECVAVISG